ncbi:hypothetical protein PROVRETT_08509 [Providencia rettgeri DSM 1131]|nr:hypothetical protein PROVRETT_08509 [Providencia rettgeri DSM 1131]
MLDATFGLQRIAMQRLCSQQEINQSLTDKLWVIVLTICYC